MAYIGQIQMADGTLYDMKGKNIIDNLTSTSIEDALSANQGRVLNASLTSLDNTLTETATQLQDADAALEEEIAELKAEIGVAGEDVVGLQVDYANKIFKRLGAASDLSAGSDFDQFSPFGGRKRCNVADDGTINCYYGDDSYADDGSNGQVMVYQPAFFYKMTPVTLEKQSSGLGYHVRVANYYVSATQRTGFKRFPAFYDASGNEIDYVLIGAYEASLCDSTSETYFNDGTDTDTTLDSDDRICSIANVKPISGLRKTLNKTNFETVCQYRGTNWHLETVQIAAIDQWLMMIELGTMNAQNTYYGVGSITDNASYNCSSFTGSTMSLGNASGIATETTNEIGGTSTTYTTTGKLAFSYRGEENVYLNIWKDINGVNIWGDGTMNGGQPYICSDFNFNESKHSDNYSAVGFTLANTANGWISAMGYGSQNYDWLLMPTELTGTSSLPVGDYTQITIDLNGYRVAQLGGSWNGGAYCGPFCWHLINGVSYRNRHVGGRLVCLPSS